MAAHHGLLSAALGELSQVLRRALYVTTAGIDARGQCSSHAWYLAPVTPFTRRVEPERLDSLPATDPAAIRSRGDLRRLNRIMGQPAAVARLLKAQRTTDGMRRLVDLGGGDGTLLLRVARRLAPRSGQVQGVVVDRHALVSDRTRMEFARLGWQLEPATADVLEWLDRPLPPEGTVILANLFLHHFEEERLRALLQRASARS